MPHPTKYFSSPHTILFSLHLSVSHQLTVTVIMLVHQQALKCKTTTLSVLSGGWRRVEGERAAVMSFLPTATHPGPWWETASGRLGIQLLLFAQRCITDYKILSKKSVYFITLNFMERCSQFLQHNTPRSSTALKSVYVLKLWRGNFTKN